MKVYKLEIMVIDFDECGEEEIKSLIENANYPNDAISPSVMRTQKADIGEWEDSSRLNSKDTMVEEYQRLFTGAKNNSPKEITQ